jgi:hypothetical protein
MVVAAVVSFLLWSVASADAAVSVGPSGGVLKITGDAQDDRVTLRRASDPSLLEFDVDGDFKPDGTVPMGNFSSISASMGGGRDAFRIDDDGGSFTDTKQTTIRGGDGADSLSGGKGSEVIIGEAGIDLVIGDGGNDVIGGGADDDVIVWKAADGVDDVAGGFGVDLVAAIGTNDPEDFAIVPSLSAVSLRRDSSEVLHMNSIERLALQANGGSDRITADPQVGKLIKLTLSAGSGSVIGFDNDVVIGSDSADVINGAGGSDRLEGRAGDDKLFGDVGDDLLVGGAGTDELTGGTGKDVFECDGAGEALDLELLDQTQGPCVAPEEPQVPPVPPAEQPPGTEQPQGTEQPAQTIASFPAGFLGFGKPVVRATRAGLRVTLRNTSAATVRISVRVTERFGTRRAVRYRTVRKTIPTGGRAALRLRAPRPLRQRIARRLDRLGRAVRRPSVTVTNVATAGKASVRPRLTMRAR